MNAVLAPERLPTTWPAPYDGMVVSEADYWAAYYLGHDVTYEWNDGILEEKGVSDYLTFRMYDWFIQLLTEFLRVHPIADRVGLEMGFRLALPGKAVIRRPDYGVVRYDNPVPLTDLEQSYRGIFDLCIEGVSTSSKAMQERDTVVKKSEYAQGGVREYYLLHHSPQLRQFYRLNASGVYEPMPVGSGDVAQSGVLPGFQWRLRDLERRPPLQALIDDPVYAGYVLRSLQQERQAKEQERQARLAAEQRVAQEQQARLVAEQRAEQEQQARLVAEQRAEQEQHAAQQEVERLRALLRQAGMEP